MGKACQKIDLDNVKLIFVENVGNLICPEFLRLKARVVVVSVTEGPLWSESTRTCFWGPVVVINKSTSPRQWK